MTSSSASPSESVPAASRRAVVLGWLRERSGLIIAVVVCLLAVLAVRQVLKDFHYDEVVGHLSQLHGVAILAALAMTAASYLTLTGYDFSAIHYVGAKLPYRTIGLASFAGYAISNNLGFTLLSGGSIRYRIYSAAGLAPGDIARVVLFSGVTFTCGVCAVGSIALLLAPAMVAPLLHLPEWLVRGAAGALVLLLLGSLVVAAKVKRPIGLGRFRIAVPSPGLVLLQILISSTDIVLSGGALYVLLPADAGIGFPGFIAVYSAALVAALISHVPGGIGVFDSLIIFGLSGGVPVSAALGTLVAYRAIYYLLPLMVAGVLLAAVEVRARRAVAAKALRWLGGFTPQLVPPAMATMIFLGGIVLLVSGATPGVPWRIRWLLQVLPLGLIEVAHVLASLVGLGLLLLARGLYRRLDGAYVLSIVLLAAGAVLSLLKGFAWVEAVVLTFMLAMLLPCRREFYRKATLTDLRFSPGWLLLIGAALLGTTWLMFLSYQHVEIQDDMWWQVAAEASAPRSLRATFVVFLAMTFFCLHQMLRPAPLRPASPTPEDLERVRRLVAMLPGAGGQLALLGDKSLLFNDEGTAFLMYGVRDQSWIALGDPVGPPRDHGELIWRFREMCDKGGARPAFHQVTPEDLPHYLDVGLTLLKLGEEARVDLATFTLDQPDRKELRYVLRRAEKDGLDFDVVPRDRVPEILDELAAVSDAWLADKNTAEMRFSVGSFDRRYITEFDIAVVRQSGRIVGFANLWLGSLDSESGNGDAGLDLIRYEPDAPPFAVDYLFIRMLLWAREQGYRRFDLGMAPMFGAEAIQMAPLWQRLGQYLFQRGDPFCNFRAARRYKEKFGPAWEPRYLACPGGLAPAQVLADAAALIAGGTLRGVPTQG